METPKPGSNPLQQIANWIKTHWIPVIILLVLTLFGFSANIYRVFFPPKPDLRACINPIQTPIVQASSNSDLSISYKNVPVNDNVTAVQVAFWNEGKLPVKADDVLKPIVIRFPDRVRLLEVKGITVSRDEAKLSTSTMQAQGDKFLKPEVGINFKILEQNDGILLQFVYAGPPEPKFTIEGSVVGQRNIKWANPNQKTRIPEWLYIFLFICLWITMAGSYFNTQKLAARTNSTASAAWMRLSQLLMLLSFLCGLVFIIKHFWINPSHVTPFGF